MCRRIGPLGLRKKLVVGDWRDWILLTLVIFVKVHVNCAIIRIACLICKDNEGNERSVPYRV